ncbi:MAG: universal stress protein [Nocardioidaceae bacterium]
MTTAVTTSLTSTVRTGSVVVGIDGSVSSDAALEWAAHYAGERRRPLVVVHGAGDVRTHTEFVDAETESRVLLAGALRVTDHARGVLEQEAPGLDMQVLSPLEDPRDTLVELSERASMVVVGTRGLGPVKALLLGSVSTALVSHATCPVAVVRPPAGSPDVITGSVVVGTDGGQASVAALELAFELASTADVDLVVVHSYVSSDRLVDWASYELRVQEIDEHDRILSESLAGYAEKYPDVTVVRHLASAGPVQALVDLSAGASAVVVGSRGRTGWAGTFASVSRDVVELAHCTVVVVRA